MSSLGLQERDTNVSQNADESHGSNELARLMRSYLTTKTSQRVAATMANFSPTVTYSDAVLGWVMDYESLEQVYAEFMPKWGDGENYPTRLLGDERSAAHLSCSVRRRCASWPWMSGMARSFGGSTIGTPDISGSTRRGDSRRPGRERKASRFRLLSECLPLSRPSVPRV